MDGVILSIFLFLFLSPKVAEQELENKSKLLASADQAAKLSARLTSSLTTCDTLPSDEAPNVVSAILNDILCDVVQGSKDLIRTCEAAEIVSSLNDIKWER